MRTTPTLSKDELLQLFPMKYNTANENVFHLLVGRGFLMEFKNNRLRLSDGAMLVLEGKEYRRDLSDVDYLNQLLRRSALPRLDSDRSFRVPDRLFSESDYERFVHTLFYTSPVRHETQWWYDLHWAPELQPVAEKVIANDLESLIALLVKSLCLVGVKTIMSCDGHGDDPARVWYLSPHHVDWLRAVMDLASKSIALKANWNVKNGELEIEKGRHRRYGVEYFREVQQVARFIYFNRVKLRSLKLKIACPFVSQYARHYAQHLRQRSIAKEYIYLDEPILKAKFKIRKEPPYRQEFFKDRLSKIMPDELLYRNDTHWQMD